MSKNKQQQKKPEVKPKISQPIPEQPRSNFSFDPELLNQEGEILVINTEKLGSIFDEHDTDKDGKINQKELFELVKKIDNVSDQQLKNLKAAFNTATEESEDKLINFETFVVLYKPILKERKLEKDADEVMKAFKTFDKDGNGVISQAEMKHILQAFGENVTDEDVEEIFNEADTNKDGNIDYQEFVDFYKQNFSD